MVIDTNTINDTSYINNYINNYPIKDILLKSHYFDSLNSHKNSVQHCLFLNNNLEINYNDSNLGKNNNNKQNFNIVKSVFSVKPPSKIEQIVRTTPFSNFISVYILILSLIVAWFFAIFRNRIIQLFKSFFSEQYINQYIRDTNSTTNKLNSLLYFFSISSFSIFTYLFIVHKEIISPFLSNFALIFAILSAYWILKSLIIKTIGFVFDYPVSAKYYTLLCFIFNTSLSIFIFPITTILYFANAYEYFFIIFIIIIISYLYRFFRLFIFGIKANKFPLLYNLLYLCTLEILPLLILLKFAF